MNLRCDFETCTQQACAFHVFRVKFACASHVMEWKNEAAAVMTVMFRIRPRICRMGCGREATLRASRSGDFYCARHAEAFPAHLFTNVLGDQSVESLVEVSLGSKEGEYNLIPLVEVSNALGKKGYQVFNLSWREITSPQTLRDSTVRLHVEPFQAPDDLDPKIKSQLETLEKQYASLKNDYTALLASAKSTRDEYRGEQERNEVLVLQMAKLKDDLQQSHLRYQALTADSRIEPLEIPRLDFDLKEFA